MPEQETKTQDGTPTREAGTRAVSHVAPRARMALRFRPMASDNLGKWVYIGVFVLLAGQFVALVLFDIL